KMFSRLKALGYREVTLAIDTVIGKTGQIIRGHEFHYSELAQTASSVPTAYRVSDRAGMDKVPEGYWVNQTLASYNHLHFGSQPQTAVNFVKNCQNYRQKKEEIHETR
ncbi:MAG: cobyrinate a,c-diamide synthase, partial [Desulfobacterales bacterium]